MPNMSSIVSEASQPIQKVPSRLPQFYEEHRSVLRRLDGLGSLLASKVAAHRRRATNLLEETPTYRRTHLRLFISHRIEDVYEADCDGEKKENDGKCSNMSASVANAAARSKVPGSLTGSSFNLTTSATTEALGKKTSDVDNAYAATTESNPLAGGVRGGKNLKALLSSATQNTQDDAKAVDADAVSAAKTSLPKKERMGRKWTLVIEGRLLVDHLDHTSAKEVDSRIDAGLPILGYCDESDILNDKSGESEMDSLKLCDQSKSVSDLDLTGRDKGSSKAVASCAKQEKMPQLSPMPTPASSRATIPLRDQWRGGVSEREGEMVIEPVIFTHLFDRLEVSLKIARKLVREETNDSVHIEDNLESPAYPRSSNRLTPRHNDYSGGSDTRHPGKATKLAEFIWEEKTFAWERNKARTPDAHAFFITYEEMIDKQKPQPTPTGPGETEKPFKSRFIIDHIDGMIKLYRRQGEEGNYKPSKEMCDVFFPTFIGKKPVGFTSSLSVSGGRLKHNKLKKRKLSLAQEASGSTISSIPTTPSGHYFKSRADSTPSPRTPSTPMISLPSTPSTASNPSPLQVTHRESAVAIPSTITFDEALYAVFFYIRTRGLQDSTDLSVINNDEALSGLFGCDRMLLSSVRDLLLQKGLLSKVKSCTAPIVLRYTMTQDGAEPFSPSPPSKTIHDPNEGESSDKCKNTQSKKSKKSPTMISCDVDVQIPNLYHVRTRDILRRTKYREFEYTSSRTKATKSLAATKLDEETTKHVLEDVVIGRGYAPHHKQAWLALARGSHEGGEAQRAALIDLRTTALIEKLEERCSVAQAYWEVVDACQSL